MESYMGLFFIIATWAFGGWIGWCLGWYYYHYRHLRKIEGIESYKSCVDQQELEREMDRIQTNKELAQLKITIKKQDKATTLGLKRINEFKYYTVDSRGDITPEGINYLVSCMDKMPVNSRIDMTETVIPTEGGQSGSIGGWFAYFARENGIILKNYECSLFGTHDKGIGAEIITRILGFKYDFELLWWARYNPELWGNEYGKDMFDNALSYGYKKNDKIFINSLAAHWRRVGKRVEEYNKWLA